MRSSREPFARKVPLGEVSIPMAVWQATTSVIDNWRKQAFTLKPALARSMRVIAMLHQPGFGSRGLIKQDQPNSVRLLGSTLELRT
jgi:hypothetical protein